MRLFSIVLLMFVCMMFFQTPSALAAEAVFATGADIGELLQYAPGSASDVTTVFLVWDDGMHPFDTYQSFLEYSKRSGRSIRHIWFYPELTVVSHIYARQILAADAADKAAYPYTNGALINENGTIYMIRGKKKVPFVSMSVFTRLGYSVKKVLKTAIPQYEFSKSTIGDEQYMHPFGSFVSYKGTIYLVHESGLVGVPSWPVFVGNRGQLQWVMPANQADINFLAAAYPVQSPLGMHDIRLAHAPGLLD